MARSTEAGICYPPDVLDQVFANWCAHRRLMYLPRTYKSYPRSSKNGQAFENWLWRQGGSVRQIDGRRFLVFSEPDQGFLFMLRWV